MSDPIPHGAPGCDRCDILRRDVAFWREQQKLAASIAATLADVNDYDGRVAALRSMLGAEKERRREAERQNAVLVCAACIASRRAW